MVAFDALWAALMLPVTCGELDGVSEAEGNCAAVVVGAAVAEGALVVGVGPEEPVMRTDIDVAGVSGTVAQFDPLGIGTRALLAAATTPMKPNAATLPSRPMRSDLDCIAYQSSSFPGTPRRAIAPPTASDQRPGDATSGVVDREDASGQQATRARLQSGDLLAVQERHERIRHSVRQRLDPGEISGRDLLAGEVPDDRTELEVGGEAEPVVDPVH